MITKEQQQALEQAACASRERAYAPYSNYQVGAAVLTADGTIYTGVNIENVAYNPSICAERVAIFKAVEAGEPEIVAVAVCTKDGGSPCGPCRQVMREFASDLPVYICDTAGHHRETTLQALLPDAFGPGHLQTES